MIGDATDLNRTSRDGEWPDRRSGQHRRVAEHPARPEDLVRAIGFVIGRVPQFHLAGYDNGEFLDRPAESVHDLATGLVVLEPGRRSDPCDLRLVE